MNDTRIVELEALAHEEGFQLPYSSDYIAWLEDRGCVVDLNTGIIYRAVAVTPSHSALAVCHLLASVQGDISI